MSLEMLTSSRSLTEWLYFRRCEFFCFLLMFQIVCGTIYDVKCETQNILDFNAILRCVELMYPIMFKLKRLAKFSNKNYK